MKGVVSMFIVISLFYQTSCANPQARCSSAIIALISSTVAAIWTGRPSAKCPVQRKTCFGAQAAD
jgi:hypothetical protein